MGTEIHGFCDPQFSPFRDAFEANFEAGLELGASLAVTWRGRVVADLWAGYADVERTCAWEMDTIVPVASTTKIMIMIAALMVIERGLPDRTYAGRDRPDRGVEFARRRVSCRRNTHAAHQFDRHEHGP